MVLSYINSLNVKKHPRIEYARRSNGIKPSIILIRSQDGKKKHVNPNDRLFFVGIYTDDNYLEVPYAYIDQLEMFRQVTLNIKDPIIKNNEVKQIKDYIDKFANNHNLYDY